MVGSYFEVAATDGSGCTAVARVTGSPRFGIGLGATLLETCQGQSLTFDIYIGYGEAPYRFTLDGVYLGEEFSSQYSITVRGGNHTIVATDSSIPMQTFVKNFTVREYKPFSISISKTATTGADGVIDASATWEENEYAFFIYDLSGPVSLHREDGSGLFASLPAGLYTLTVTEYGSGCSQTLKVDIVFQSLWIVDKINPRCSGAATGSLTLAYSAATLTQPVTIIKEGFGPISALVVDGLRAGEHKFILTDSSQPPARLTLSEFLTEPTPLAAYVHLAPINPTAPAQGSSFSLAATGGTGSFDFEATVMSFQSRVPKVFRNSSGFSNTILPFGDVRYTVTDQNGCRVVDTVNQNDPTVLQLSKIPVPICNGVRNTSFSVLAKGGVLPFHFSIESRTNQSIPEVLCSDFECAFSNVTAGDYVINAVDDSELSRFASLVVQVSQTTLSARAVSISATPAGTDGSVSIQALGNADGPFQYLLSSPSGLVVSSAIGQFRSLTAGSYEYSVQAPSGCQFNGVVDVVETFTASVVSVDPQSSCRADGVIRLDIVGGVAPLTFSYNSVKYKYLRTDLPAGIYSVVVEDSSVPARAVLLGDVEVPIRPTLAVEVETRRQNRYLEWGSAFIRVKNAVEPLSTFTIGGSAAVVGMNYGLGSGLYDVIVVDATGCSASAVADVTVRDVVASISTSSKPKCCGDDVYIELQSHPSWEYARVDLEIWQDSPLFTGLRPGILYSFFVREKLDPDDVETVEFIMPDVTCLKLTGVTTLVRGSSTSLPTIKIDAEGESLSYFIDDGTAETTDSLIVSAGSHDLRIVDGSGCQVSSTFSALSVPVVSVLVPPLSCAGSNESSVVLDIFGGMPPYHIATDTNSIYTNTVFNAVKPGSYYWEVSDSGIPPWKTTVSFVVASSNAMSWISKEFKFLVVESNQTASFVAPVTGGSAPYRFELAGITNASVQISQLSPSFSGIAQGTYLLGVRDANGCELSETVKIFTRRTFLANDFIIEFFKSNCFSVQLLARAPSHLHSATAVPWCGSCS
jgi:large repetitive protein